MCHTSHAERIAHYFKLATLQFLLLRQQPQHAVAAIIASTATDTSTTAEVDVSTVMKKRSQLNCRSSTVNSKQLKPVQFNYVDPAPFNVTLSVAAILETGIQL